MLRILSRRSVDVGPGYDFLVLTDSRRIWVRVKRSEDGTLLRFWSRDAEETSQDDIGALFEQVEHALNEAATAGVADYNALTFWPPGWELWIGIPVPISEDYAAPVFQARIAQFGIDGR